MKGFILSSLTLIFLLSYFFLISNKLTPLVIQSKNSQLKEQISLPVYRVEERIVRGKSMSGIIEEGEGVKIVFGYYKDNEVKRGDMIAYKFSGNEEPIIKIVLGVPDDRFELVNLDGKWHLKINGQILKNSLDEPYILDERGYKILSLYINDYRGIIPKDSYLIFGNLSQGSMDSARFGLVGKSDIVGKVIYGN